MVVYALFCVGALVALAAVAIAVSSSPRAGGVVYGLSLILTSMLTAIGLF